VTRGLRLAVPLLLVATACTSGDPAQPTPPEPDAARPSDAAPPVDANLPCFGCTDAGYPDIDASLGRKAQLQLDSCASNEGCHGAQPGINLTYIAPNEFDQLRNVPSIERPSLMRVLPGDPAQSYLYLKVVGDGGIDGGRMPLGAAFDPRIPALFFEWIEAGAPDAE
jgi:hypothetical protein